MTKLAPSIALIYMGGTFGCTGTPLAPLAAPVFLPLMQQLVGAQFPAIHRLVSSHIIKDSSALNPQDWIDLIVQINQLVGQGHQHILIIHGTDTLAYTAAFLAQYFSDDSLQLVVTGSQFPLLEPDGQHLNPDSDALLNLRLAYQQLSHVRNTGQQNTNCWVAFGGQIWPALSVQKIHSTATPTFAGQQPSPQSAQQSIQQITNKSTQQPGQHGSQAEWINAVTKSKQSIDLSQLENLNIAIYYALPLSACQQAIQLQHYLTLNKLQAIVILAFGSGNLNQHPFIEQVLQQAAEQQIMVVLASQVPFGGVNSRYAAGHWLSQSGVLSANDLPLPAIYARLAYLFCQHLSFAQRQAQWQLALSD